MEVYNVQPAQAPIIPLHQVLAHSAALLTRIAITAIQQVLELRLALTA
jgi:hypothetical protein